MKMDELVKGCAGACAIRCKVELQPAGGVGMKVFPPTYSGATYVTETRRLPGRDVPVQCVLVDSVQSQANRLEMSLQRAVDDGLIKLPLVEVDFSDANEKLLKPIDDRITSLTVPHRLADAILRDCVVVGEGKDNGKLFRESSFASKWRKASPSNATAVFELCPTALVFGMWGSPDKPGGLGAKFQRCITSEIVGIDAVTLEKSRQGLRTDPLSIVKNADVVVDRDGGWVNATGSKANKKRPSEINHGPILFGPTHGGATFARAEQTMVITLAGLRWLRFPDRSLDVAAQNRRNEAARMVLTSIALCAATLSHEAGFDLRSGCLLHTQQAPKWELLDGLGGAPIELTITSTQAVELLNKSVAAAKKAGLPWRTDPIKLKPSDELVTLIQRSQELAAKEAEDKGPQQ
jgi:CRISPR-associated protein Csb1